MLKCLPNILYPIALESINLLHDISSKNWLLLIVFFAVLQFFLHFALRICSTLNTVIFRNKIHSLPLSVSAQTCGVRSSNCFYNQYVFDYRVLCNSDTVIVFVIYLYS